MNRIVVSRSLFAFLVLTACALGADEKRSDKVPELKVLEHYAGSWNIEITSKGIPFTTGNVTTKWILDGMYLQQSGELRSSDGKLSIKSNILYTYDPNKKVYRSWTFLSDGFAGETEGTWDAQRSVMTFVSRKNDDGGVSTTTADFSQEGVEKWKIIYKDAAGQIVTEMSGRNSRQKVQKE